MRPVDHIGDWADLGNSSGIHHRHPVGGLGDHAHVVGHQHDRRAVLPAKPLEQRNDLRLDRDVERGRRLVGDDQPRLGGQRKRNHDPLAHAARELVRIVVKTRRGRRNTGAVEQLDRAAARLRRGEVEMGADRLDQLPADRLKRVE